MLVSAFEAVADAPVFSAAEADLALARGAALAAARTLDMSGPWPWEPTVRRSRRTGVLAAILTAAVVTFVVSVSLALGRQLTHDTPPRPETVTAAAEYAPVTTARPSVTFPEAGRALAQTMIPKAPPPPVAVADPAIVAPPDAPPPAALPPAVAPAPVYVPPPVPPTQPRLRDRILDRLPIIGRFHNPGN